MAPLYNESPIVPDIVRATDTVERKLATDVAVRTLDIIGEVLDSFEAKAQRKRVSKASFSPKLCLARVGLPLLYALLWAGVVAVTVILYLADGKSIRDCETTLAECQSPDRPLDAELQERCQAAPQLSFNGGAFVRPNGQACIQTRGTFWPDEGLIVWKWLCFLALWPPLGLLAQGLAKAIAAFISWQASTGNVVFLTFGLHRQLGYAIQAASWFGLWFAIVARELSWAHSSSDWNARAGTEVWSDEFEEVHFYMWRTLLIIVIWRVMCLLRAALAKWLSLQFHHQNHFERMQKALVHEHVIQVLSQPHHLQLTTLIRVGDRSLELSGFACAHWAALQFVNRLASDAPSLLSDFNEGDADKVPLIKDKAAALQLRLAHFIDEDYHKRMLASEDGTTAMDHSDVLEDVTAAFTGKPVHSDIVSVTPDSNSKPSGRYDATTNGMYVPDDGSSAIVAPVAKRTPWDDGISQPPQRSSASTRGMRASSRASTFTPQDIVDAASSIVGSSTRDGAAARAAWRRLHVKVKTDLKDEGVPRPLRRARRIESDDQVASEAADALLELKGDDAEESKGPGNRLLHLRRRKAQRLASELAEAQVENTLTVHNTVNQVQTYLTGNSYIRVFSLDEKSGHKTTEKEELKSTEAARQLGYYLFWNLRRDASAGLALSESDVLAVAKAAGLRHVGSAWELLDRNGDSSATLEEVLNAVAQVYTNRKYLAATLEDNKSVVSQVEIAIGVFFFIILIFIMIGVFDPGAVQDTWTALSAGLLSLTFVFGNSIKELFENTVFLFFTHPFDVGDIIIHETNRYTVSKISLQYVNFERSDGAYVTVATSALRLATIHNITRSKLAWEGLEIPVDMDLQPGAVERVATEVVACIKLHPTWFGGDYRVFLMDPIPGFKLKLACYFNHPHSGTDLLKRGLARTALLGAMARGLQAAGITYTLPAVRKGGDNVDGDDALEAMRGAAGGDGGDVESAATLTARKEDTSALSKAAAAAAANNMLLMS